MVSRRGFLAAAAAAAGGLAPIGIARPARAADKPSQIRIDWATYNPVSMVLKQKGTAGEGIRQGRHRHALGAVARLQQGAGISQRRLDRFRLDCGLGGAAGRINGDPIKSIYVYSKPEWTALVTRKDTSINTVADLKGKRVAVTRGTDPHIFLVRALLSAGMTEKDISEVLLQHPDGKIALDPRRRRCLGGPRSDDGAGAGRGRRPACSIATRRQHLRHPQCQRGFSRQISRADQARARGLRQEPANSASPITTRRSASS